MPSTKSRADESEPITVESDWFTLRNAVLQVRPFTKPHMPLAVASMQSPAGPALAGKYGAGLLSIGVKPDEVKHQTAYLRMPESNQWWYWHGNEIEANAYYLKLLSLTGAKDEKASRLVKYLLK